MSRIRVYVANLGKYNEGELLGDWIDLPASEEDMNDLFVRIKLGDYIDGDYEAGHTEYGIIYEEYAIHDYETDIPFYKIGEHSNLDDLNSFAEKVEELNESDFHKLCAMFEHDSTYNDKPESALDELDGYDLMEDINNDEELGYYWLFESGCYEVPENLQNYIDCEAFGRDIRLESAGDFTEYGWLVNN